MILAFIFGLSSIVIIVKLYNKLTVGWCKSQVCLKRKTAIVTGANTGKKIISFIDIDEIGHSHLSIMFPFSRTVHKPLIRKLQASNKLMIKVVIAPMR